MKCRIAQETILNDNNVLLLSPTGSGKTLAFFAYIRNVTPEILFGSMFNSSSFKRIRIAN
jgi:ATP-dependent protease Clp ATPase subunit